MTSGRGKLAKKSTTGCQDFEEMFSPPRRRRKDLGSIHAYHATFIGNPATILDTLEWIGAASCATCPSPSPELKQEGQSDGISMFGNMHKVAIIAALTLAGCSMAAFQNKTDFRGKPLSAVIAKLGQPNETQTVAGQKAYVWIMGNALYECRIRVVMAGDVVDTYEGFGDVNVCGQYGALSGGLKGYE
jgi:hypothetical protein